MRNERSARACNTRSTCRLCIAKLTAVDPRAWLADGLARIGDHPTKHLDELPWRWNANREPRAEAA
jgi:hypothetical protein